MSTWAIIGASRGLGYELLRQLSSDPSNTVIGTARTPSKVTDQLAQDNLTRSNNIHIFAADLDDPKTLATAASEIAAAGHKSIDYLIVNGAYVSGETGGLPPTAFAGQEDLLERELTQSIRTNTIGPLHTINAFLPLIRAGRAKTIIVISTGMADVEFTRISGIPIAIPYAASKAATNMVVAKFAAELKSEDIKVVALSPGLVKTSLDDQSMAAISEAMKPYEPKFRGAITPEQSIRAMVKVIANRALITESSGTMISHLGNQRWLSADGLGDEVAV